MAYHRECRSDGRCSMLAMSEVIMKKKTTTKKKRGSAQRAARKAAPKVRLKARGRGKIASKKWTKPAPSFRGAARTGRIFTNERARGLGPEAGGQSGDTEGLSSAETADSESVKELVEEGQPFEAGIISGVENARDADKGEVRTRQVPEDDVPKEYLDED